MPKSLYNSVCQQILPLFIKSIFRKKQEFWVKTSSYVSIFFPKKNLTSHKIFPKLSRIPLNRNREFALSYC